MGVPVLLHSPGRDAAQRLHRARALRVQTGELVFQWFYPGVDPGCWCFGLETQAPRIVSSALDYLNHYLLGPAAERPLSHESL